MIEFITNNLPLLMTAIGGVFGGGWFVWRRKKGSVTAGLAKNEIIDVSSMVSIYTKSLGELSQDITKLHEELTDVKTKQLEIEKENRRLKEENAVLKNRIKNLENEQHTKSN